MVIAATVYYWTAVNLITQDRWSAFMHPLHLTSMGVVHYSWCRTLIVFAKDDILQLVFTDFCVLWPVQKRKITRKNVSPCAELNIESTLGKVWYSSFGLDELSDGTGLPLLYGRWKFRTARQDVVIRSPRCCNNLFPVPTISQSISPVLSGGFPHKVGKNHADFGESSLVS